MARKKKTRIYLEPDFTESDGYVLADAGENKPTGKLSFANLGKYLDTNPKFIIFQKENDVIVPYRVTSFDITQGMPEMEQVDFKWFNDNSSRLYEYAANIMWDYQSEGWPIFYTAGLFTDTLTSQPYVEFTRFDSTENQTVVEHSIIVSTDGYYPFTTGNTICTERKVTIEHPIEHVNAGQAELVPVNKTVTIPYAAAGVHPSHTATIGGSTYRTVTMPDGKEWLAENLDYQFAGCTFNPSSWVSRSPSCCYYNGGSTEYKPHYGLLYNWYAVEYLTANKTTLIPGWHVPTQEEWLTLFTSLQGGIATAGAALKTTTGWSFNGDTSPSRNGTDDYNFSVLPSGVRNFNNAMINEGSNGYFWSSVGFSSTDAYYVEFKSYGNDVDSVVNSTGDKYNGYPLRLVKDTAPDPDIPTTGGLMTPTMVDNLNFANSTLRANVNTRSVLEAYPDPNDSTIIRYRWVPVGTVVV